MVKAASGLPIMNSSNNRTDAFVKLYLLPRRQITKKKTKLIKDCLTPEWNEQFEFKSVSLEDLKSRQVLECSVWDYDVRGCNDFIGCIRLGPDPEKYEKEEWMDSFGEEVSQWEAMLETPEKWVEREHMLRPSIEALGIGGEPLSYQQDVADQESINSSAVSTATSAAEQIMPSGDHQPSYSCPTGSLLESGDPISEEEKDEVRNSCLS